jgi:lysine 2,3-aminomutase
MYHGGSGSVGRPEVLTHRPDLADVWDAAHHAFPIRITRAFADRIRDWSGPLARQVLPDPQELLVDPEDISDPVGDAQNSPVPWVVHKYPDRVLLLVTKRCHLYCRYCFRRNHDPGEGMDPSAEEWAAALAYACSSGAREVILSGGDPLTLANARLMAIIDHLRPHFPVLRIHTRAPVTHPRRITDELISGLSERGPIWVVIHANHVDEIDEDVRAAVSGLIDAGIVVLNQAVLLAGVNDDVDSLVALSHRLVEMRVTPYYLHHPDHAAGNAHFRVSRERGIAIHQALETRLSGIALPRYVVDGPEGKRSAYNG